MKVWVTTGFTGHWPVGTSAVIAAHNAVEAADFVAVMQKRRILPISMYWPNPNPTINTTFNIPVTTA